MRCCNTTTSHRRRRSQKHPDVATNVTVLMSKNTCTATQSTKSLAATCLHILHKLYLRRIEVISCRQLPYLQITRYLLRKTIQFNTNTGVATRTNVYRKCSLVVHNYLQDGVVNNCVNCHLCGIAWHEWTSPKVVVALRRPIDRNEATERIYANTSALSVGSLQHLDTKRSQSWRWLRRVRTSCVN